jgi:hypothetical protein
VNGASAHRGLLWDWNAVSWTKTVLDLPTVSGMALSRA